MKVDILLQLLISHLIFDYGYALSKKMINAKSIGKPIFPIMIHAFFHSIGVFIVLFINNIDLKLCIISMIIEFISHTIIDITKGLLQNKYDKLRDNKNPWYWHLFQIDQLLHILTKYIIIKII